MRKRAEQSARDKERHQRFEEEKANEKVVQFCHNLSFAYHQFTEGVRWGCCIGGRTKNTPAARGG